MVRILSVFILTVIAVMAYWVYSASPNSSPPVSQQNMATMANPASVYCEQQKGSLEIRKDDQGNETGYCHLPDGHVIEEWEFFRQQRQNQSPAP